MKLYVSVGQTIGDSTTIGTGDERLVELRGATPRTIALIVEAIYRNRYYHAVVVNRKGIEVGVFGLLDQRGIPVINPYGKETL